MYYVFRSEEPESDPIDFGWDFIDGMYTLCWYEGPQAPAIMEITKDVTEVEEDGNSASF